MICYVMKDRGRDISPKWLAKDGSWVDSREDALAFEGPREAHEKRIELNDANVYVWSEVTSEQRARWDRQIAERAKR